MLTLEVAIMTTKSCEPAQIIYHACEPAIISLTTNRETTYNIQTGALRWVS